MIVWSGKGFLSLLVLVALFFICVQIFPEEFGDYAFVISFYLTGIFSWIYGVKWNSENERIVVDEKTGQRIKIRNNHTLFWIPMQYWGIIFPLLGAIILFQNSVIAGAISIIVFGIIAYLQFYRKKNTGKLSTGKNEPIKSKLEIRSKDKPILEEKITEKNIDRIKIEPQKVKKKEISEMTKEEIEAYHKKYMPK